MDVIIGLLGLTALVAFLCWYVGTRDSVGHPFVSASMRDLEAEVSAAEALAEKQRMMPVEMDFWEVKDFARPHRQHFDRWSDLPAINAYRASLKPPLPPILQKHR